jgi:hypothetical protein
MNPFLKPYRTLCMVLPIWLSIAAVLGCDYHFRPTGQPLGIQIQSLAIPLMKSTSSFLGFEGDFTRTIREEFVSHAKVPLVPKDKAQLVLIGKVYEIKTEPLTYSLDQSTVQNRVVTHEVTSSRWLKIKMTAKLIENNTGQVIWEDKVMEEKATFSVGADPLVNRYNQRKAIREIAQILAKRIYSKTMERF